MSKGLDPGEPVKKLVVSELGRSREVTHEVYPGLCPISRGKGNETPEFPFPASKEQR